MNYKLLESEKSIDNKNNHINELELKSKLNINTLNNVSPGDTIIAITFRTFDESINYCLPCKTSDSFVEIEKKLLLEFPEFKDKDIKYNVNGNKIKSYKTLEENNIKSGSIIIINFEDE